MSQHLFKNRADEAMAQFQDRKIIHTDNFANYFGLESQGIKQIRGNGILILTEKELYFELYLPKKTITIPTNQILRIETPRSHLGKSKFKKLLKIIFTNQNQEKDSIAWIVKQLPKWIETIEKIIKRKEVTPL
jgi:hypothetical protein